MHAAVFYLAILWLLALVAVLVWVVVRERPVVPRVLALDTVALLFVAALVVVSVRRGDPRYLDVGLVLAMLGFVQTVATARLVERSGRL